MISIKWISQFSEWKAAQDVQIVEESVCSSGDDWLWLLHPPEVSLQQQLHLFAPDCNSSRIQELKEPSPMGANIGFATVLLSENLWRVQEPSQILTYESNHKTTHNFFLGNSKSTHRPFASQFWLASTPFASHLRNWPLLRLVNFRKPHTLLHLPQNAVSSDQKLIGGKGFLGDFPKSCETAEDDNGIVRVRSCVCVCEREREREKERERSFFCFWHK